MEIGVRQPPCAGSMGLASFAKWAAEQGFKAIDVPNLDAETKQILSDHGLRVGTVDLAARWAQLSPDPERRKAGLEEQKAYLEKVAGLGAKTLFTVLLPEDPAQSRKASCELWQEFGHELVALLEQYELSLAIEGWPGPGPWLPCLGCTPETLRAVFGATPSPALGICFDPSHLVRLGIDYMRFLWEFGSRVKHVHGKDTETSAEWQYLTGNIGPSFGARYGYGESAWRYCIPGEGEVDWVAVRNRLSDHGYDGLICVELEDHNYFPEVEKQQHGLINALRYLEGVID